jgi:hypothetical protein
LIYASLLGSWENIMGNSLHNKIYLGRASVLSSRRAQAAAAIGAFVSIGLVWMLLRTLK